MQLLTAEEILDLSFAQQPLLNEVFPNRFLNFLLLPKQYRELKRAYHAVVQEKLADAFPRISVFQKVCDLRFIEPPPFLCDFAYPGALLHLPYQCPYEALPRYSA